MRGLSLAIQGHNQGEKKTKKKGRGDRVNIKQAWSTDEKGEGKGSRAVLTKGK
jgi:hypothetical protein